MWNSCSEHHVVEGIGPHKGPSEYILAHLGDDVKQDTKLFPRLPKFQPSATHHLRHPPSSTQRPDPITTAVAHMSFRCPSPVPQLSLIKAQTKLPHPHHSVPTPESKAAPPSSCLQLIKSWKLITTTSHLYPLQIQPHLQLIQPQHPLAPQETCTDNPSTATALPSLYHMGNHPPAAHAGPAHRLDEVQTREQHTVPISSLPALRHLS